jgi:Ca2+-binding EF-hand superfamily protein
MHIRILAAVVCISTLMVTAGTYADTHVDENGKNKVASTSSFAALDRNGDHRISRSEAGFDRILSQTFAEIDTDGDGFISLAEFNAAQQQSRAAVTSLER